MKSNHFNKILLIVLTTLVCSFPGHASVEKIIFASPEELPPKIFMEKGELRGTYVDIIRAICKRMNVEPVFQQYPWARAVLMAKNGKVDAIFPPFKTEERLEFLYFPETPMSYTRNVLFANKKRKFDIDSLDDLKELIVGVNDQYSYGEEFDSYKKNLKIDVSRNEEMQINKLAHSGKIRMDVAAASEEAFKFMSKKMGESKEFSVVYVISSTPSYVAFSKFNKERGQKLAMNFNKIFNQLKKEGVIQAINDRYLQ